MTQQARDYLGKSAATLTIEEVDQIATCMHEAVNESLGPVVAESVKNDILALKK